MDKYKEIGKCRFCGIDDFLFGTKIILNDSALIRQRNGDSSPVLKKAKKSEKVTINRTRGSLFNLCYACHRTAENAHKLRNKCNKSETLQELLIRDQPVIDRQRFKHADTQTEAPESATIIIQGLSSYVTENDLETTFSQYGNISRIYLPNKSSNNSRQCFARVTFATEDDALKALNARQRKEINCTSLWTMTRLSEGYSPINTLPNECLKKIFLCIDEKEDKFSIERVCKRWEKLGSESWSNFTNLSDRNSLWGNFDTNKKLEAIFQRSGSSLKSLELHVLRDPRRRLQLVSQYCENLENLQLWFNFYNQYPVQIGEFSDCLESVFQQSSKLRRLFMGQIGQEFDFNQVRHLSENMTEIHLHAQKINDTGPGVSMDLSKFHNLVALGLLNLTLSENSLRGLESLKLLEKLSFRGSNVDPSVLETIRDLTTLTSLSIPNCQINDELLSRIVLNNRNLEYLDISGMKEITDQPLKYIADLPNLIILRMNYLPKVKGTHLPQMKSLYMLHCVGCTSIVDWSLLMMIESCFNITEIYAAGVATWRLLLSAEETIKSSSIRLYKPICMYVDEDLANKWWMYGERVLKSSSTLVNAVVDLSELDSPDMQQQNWGGWFSTQGKSTHVYRLKQ